MNYSVKGFEQRVNNGDGSVVLVQYVSYLQQNSNLSIIETFCYYF